jgi:kynurenine 3-monooxygenase
MATRGDGTVAIVGGGLVGSLLASVLTRRGYAVTVHERRPDPRDARIDQGRSINLVLTRRGIRALERVGLAGRAFDLTVPVTGRMVHDLDGTRQYQPYGRDASECNYSISRAALNRYLIDAAETLGARFRFGMRLRSADLDGGGLTFDDTTTGATVEVPAERIVGADGAGSVLREAFAALDGFEHSTELLTHGYKELLLPAGPDGAYPIEAHALHIWPRGSLMLMALANVGGSFTGTLYLPVEGNDGFEALTTPQQVETLFGAQFPDAIPLIPDLRVEFFENPTGRLATVRCGPWHHRDRAFLIGDAAHAIVPFFGQGMNSGFEDCRILDDLLDEHGDDAWDRVLPEFTRTRKPDADAIAAMAIDNFEDMRDRVGDPRFLLRKAVEHRLEDAAPHEYRSRYSLVMYSHVPFDLCRKAGEVQRRILDELCDGLESADDLDLEHALGLVRTRFTPFLAEHRISLDY